ncbi:MAG TPA: carbonate dehydratase [Burkholderiales bacterium]|nr:carbonate dehydratase [Burkholderiales bacterium]
MHLLPELFEKNRQWAASRVANDPEFFARLSGLQAPPYLWIGCSDSRVPANEIVGLLPGEMFVHRNVANVVVHTDLNCLAAVQYAVDVLKVSHVMVVGHYGCGGVRAALERNKLGLIDNWLRHVQDVRSAHRELVDTVRDPVGRVDRLCELNALEQAVNLCETTIVLDAWARGQPLAVHAWCYGIEDGLLRDLGYAVDDPASIRPAFDAALAEVAARPDGAARRP